MIIKTYFECSTCSQKHAFRIQIGHSNYQKHEVKCNECHEKMVISLDLDQESGSILGVNGIDNCQMISLDDPSEDSQLPTEYLSDSFQVSESDKGEQMSFPALKFMREFNKKIEEGELTPYTKAVPTHILEQWKIIKKSWTLTRNNQHQLAKKEFEKYNEICEINELDLESALYEFIREYISINPFTHEVFVTAMHWLRSIDAKKTKELAIYFDTVSDEHMRRNYEVFDSFFSNYSEFSQVQFSNILPDSFVVTSNSFDTVKMFYGTCFEHLGSNLDIIACLNNIHNNRNYDQFKEMDLKKYNENDKAGRLGPLQNTPEIIDIFKSFDNKLRNASHHGHIVCENDIVKYKSKQNKQYHEMTYTNYLISCKAIFDSTCIILMLEILFKKIICVKSKQPKKSTLGNAIKQGMHKT